MELWTLLISNYASIVCLLAGIVLVIVEMMMPGFGVPGLSGIALIAVGILITGGTVPQMLLLTGIVLLILLIALPFCLRAVAKGKFRNSRISLNAVSLEHGTGEEFHKYEACRGTALTTLRPSGIALINGDKINVVTQGEFIPAETEICVEKVEGNRIVVRKAD